MSIDWTSSGHYSVIFSITSSIETLASTISQEISKKFIPKAKGFILNPDSQVNPSYLISLWILLAKLSKSYSTS